MLTGLCEVKRFAVSFYCLCLSFKHFLLPGPYITLLYALLSFKSLLSNLALSLPVISFFEGDDAKMLFFSLSLRPLWVCFYFTSRKFIFVMRFISEHVNTVSQSRGSPSCVWVLSGGCQARVSFHLVVTGRMNAFKKTQTTLHKKPFTEVLNFL